MSFASCRWLALVVPLLSCGGPSDLQLLQQVADGFVGGSSLSVTLPATYLGRTAPPEPFFLENAGSQPLTVRRVDWADGASSASFDVQLELPAVLAPGERRMAFIDFHPVFAEGGDLELSAEATFVVDRGPARTLAVRGVGRGHDCSVPGELDFLAESVGESTTRSLVLENDTDEATTAELTGAFSESDEHHFSVAGSVGRSARVDLPARGSATVAITFAPSESRDYLESLQVRRTAGCPARPLRLFGTGVLSCLRHRAAPSSDPINAGALEFEFVEPGLRAEGEVRLFNVCADAVVLNDLRVTDTTFSLPGRDAGSTLVLPGATRREANQTIIPTQTPVSVAFSPTSLGTRASYLRANTNVVNPASYVVPMRGFGAYGPRLELTPGVLDFGEVAYFPGAMPPTSAELSVRLRNSREASVSAIELLFGRGGPAVTVAPGTGASASELCVGETDATTATCLGTVDGRSLSDLVLRPGASVDLPIRLRPASVGSKAWTISFRTNDQSQPEARLEVHATAVTSPACTYELPTSIDFGSVAPPKRRHVGLTLRNTGANDCSFTGLHATGALGGRLSLSTGADGGVGLRVAPGEARTVELTLTPPDTLDGGLLGGAVVLNANSLVASVSRVPVSAQAYADCLNLTMDDVDFGAVPLSCASAERTFRAYNRCATPVLIQSARLSTSGASDGGAAFEWGTDGGIVGALAPSGVRSFTVRFRPPGPGIHFGVVELATQQDGATTLVTASLRGTGDATGLQEDVFRQPAGQRADVLLVIDASPATAAALTSLPASRAALLQYATQTNADFHLGVTAYGANRAPGELVLSPAGWPYLTGATPDLSAQFEALVSVGSFGGGAAGLEATLQALTPPLTAAPYTNRGFQRDEALLGVILFSAQLERSPEPLGWYVDQLLDVKGPRRANDFSVSVLGPFVAGGAAPCAWAAVDQPGSGRYSGAAAALSGRAEDLCGLRPPTSGALGRAWARALGARERVLLTSRPAPGVEPEVFVGGQRLPSGTLSWSYDGVENAIVFVGQAAPGPGETVRVRYGVACLP